MGRRDVFLVQAELDGRDGQSADRKPFNPVPFLEGVGGGGVSHCNPSAF